VRACGRRLTERVRCALEQLINEQGALLDPTNFFASLDTLPDTQDASQEPLAAYQGGRRSGAAGHTSSDAARQDCGVRRGREQPAPLEPDSSTTRADTALLADTAWATSAAGLVNESLRACASNLERLRSEALLAGRAAASAGGACGEAVRLAGGRPGARRRDQLGVARVNCIDCLDRTNVVQVRGGGGGGGGGGSRPVPASAGVRVTGSVGLAAAGPGLARRICILRLVCFDQG